MKKYSLFFALVMVFAFACTDSVSYPAMPVITTSDLAEYKMKLLPESPASGDDIKLVVYEECRYNRLNGVHRNGTTIDIEKQFNSMIMAPCMLTNDTIPIGKLPFGTYRVNYKLVDIAYQPAGKTTFAVSFRLVVSK
jgi:hypothetical protein